MKKILTILLMALLTLSSSLAVWASTTICVGNIPSGGVTGGGSNGFCSMNEDGSPNYEEWDEWHFVINGLASESVAPTQMTVVFAPAVNVIVPFEKYTGGTAHYRTKGAYLTDTLLSACAELADGVTYTNFNLSHAPCSTNGGGTPQEEPEVGGEVYPNNTPVVASIVAGSVIALAGVGILLRRRFLVK